MPNLSSYRGVCMSSREVSSFVLHRCVGRAGRPPHRFLSTALERHRIPTALAPSCPPLGRYLSTYCLYLLHFARARALVLALVLVLILMLVAPHPSIPIHSYPSIPFAPSILSPAPRLASPICAPKSIPADTTQPITGAQARTACMRIRFIGSGRTWGGGRGVKRRLGGLQEGEGSVVCWWVYAREKGGEAQRCGRVCWVRVYYVAGGREMASS